MVLYRWGLCCLSLTLPASRVFVLLMPIILLTISNKWYNYAEDLKGEGL